MTKSRVCVSTNVFASRKMESLSVEARLAYIYACSETNLIGEIGRRQNVTCTVKGGERAFQELVDSGFIIEAFDEYGPRYFVAHHFVNNGLANSQQKDAAERLYADVYDMVRLPGGDEPTFKGAYVPA